MKTLSIPVHDDVYQLVQAETARQHKSLADLFSDFMASLRGAPDTSLESPATSADLTKRQQWLNRLREARSSLGTQRTGGLSTQDIFDDIRSDRC